MSTYGSGDYGVGPYSGIGISHLTASVTSSPGTVFQVQATPAADVDVVFIIASTPGGSPTPSDSTGKVWNTIATNATGTHRVSAFHAVFSGPSPGPVTFTATFSGSQTSCSLSVEEGYGVDLTSPVVQTAIASA